MHKALGSTTKKEGRKKKQIELETRECGTINVLQNNQRTENRKSERKETSTKSNNNYTGSSSQKTVEQ
jgi:hypothetical protein